MAVKQRASMLGKLFGSNARVKILKLFLLNPGQSFYLRQIARDLKLQLNSVRRELENLEKFGLLRSGGGPEPETGRESEEIFIDSVQAAAEAAKDKKDGGPVVEKRAKTDKKYYTVDTGFILYEEIKALMVKSQVLYERDFVDKLAGAGSTKLLILSGFFTNDQDSLVDLLLVGRYNKPKLLKMIKDLEEEMGREINFTMMNIQEFNYRRDITDVFLYGILERKHLIVIDEIGLS
jgi:hypothetical protein